MPSSALLIERRLTALVGQSAGRRWLSRSAPRKRPARCCAGSQDRHAARNVQAWLDKAVRVTPAMPSISASTSAWRTNSFRFSIRRSCNISVLTLTLISVGLRARRLLPPAPQVSQVGNAALIEREAVTLPLDHAFGFELADVGPAAIEMQRQCRRADGRCLSGSRSRGSFGDGGAINGAGLSRRVHSCSVTVRILRLDQEPEASRVGAGDGTVRSSRWNREV
jgi:hypothetical protein